MENSIPKQMLFDGPEYNSLPEGEPIVVDKMLFSEIKFKCSTIDCPNGEWFTASEIYTNPYNGRKNCFKCLSSKYKNQRDRYKELNKDINPYNENETKYCPGCDKNLIKIPLLWNKALSTSDGLKGYCRKCYANNHNRLSKQSRFDVKIHIDKIYGPDCLCCKSTNDLTREHRDNKLHIKDTFNNNINSPCIKQLKNYAIPKEQWFKYLGGKQLDSILEKDYEFGIFHPEICTLCRTCNSSMQQTGYCLRHQKRLWFKLGESQ